ncbi:LuxR family transcriptional regulator [Alkalihalobacillus alcalophilus ATCC 27647 = CGMCC 1.3604]|uniref:LuxR family transcriptional regulator n=1 Tax=Alkalihalobacillus alcalophilus ATCC 27647 = CGMCC 1.3604 TaxID=1218173 RepID=A0A094YX23_ALKAL|nr:response regulator transcription factor [Alkalihalobacillus alcalophilus]KGA98077.1 LuxR family transcriptional regulator [Alkalihalobacillus alcalophilus ATCC 27647 = CGMCC 1.3604]MED1561035.1 response regulator transcription factor [Alkalihalobacillus alcalophilus]THG88342.1 LuxR family transcriptional regulator [Alkalihalobacillus alcalophilus ATCC 27647 = CGMCC 1.3604]
MIRVLLVDDHEMVRMGLSAFLSTQEDMEIVGEAKNGEEGVARAIEFKPDVILMDLVMDKMDGIEATAAITKQLPETKIIVLTSFIDDEKVYPVIEAGAFSYLLKTSSAPEIATAIRAAANGEAIVEAKVTNKMMQRMRGAKEEKLHEQLTPRELEVLLLIGDGKSNQEIGEALFIGIKTVKTHVSHILDKLQLDDRTQIAIYAHRQGLAK